MAERDELFHGDELHAAIERAVGGPPAMGVCETALDTYTQAHVDEQMKEALTVDEQVRRDLVPILEQTGEEITDAMIAAAGIRVLIGGSFSFGIFVGLELERGRRAANG